MSSRMRTLLTLLSLVFATLGLVACGGGTEGGELKVTNIRPRAGATAGEQQVDIIGNNFRQDIGYTVYFGKKRSDRATFMDGNTLRVSTPSMEQPGPVDVIVVADDGPAYRIVNGFTFQEQGGNVMQQVGEGIVSGQGEERF